MQETKVFIPSKHQGVFPKSGDSKKKVFYTNKWLVHGAAINN